MSRCINDVDLVILVVNGTVFRRDCNSPFTFEGITIKNLCCSHLCLIVAEYGRQPWVVDGLLPTFMGVSSVSAASVLISLCGFILFYTLLAVVELYLMVKYIKMGPDAIFQANDFSIKPDFKGGN